MKCNPWTLALIGAGLVSLPAVTQAEEKPSSVLTAVASTTLSGYVDTSIQWNLGTGNEFTPGYAYGGGKKADGFNFNVAKISIASAPDPKDAWGAGYQVDLLAGPDAVGLGTLSSSASTSGNADFAIQQAYVDLHAPVGNGLDFKIGVWNTIIGYEVFDAPSNPNFTRSYGYTFEPTTHTGVQGTYQFCEAFSLTLGIANTFGPTINQRALPNYGPGAGAAPTTWAESYKTYMASFTLTAPKDWGFLGGSTLSACVINGFNSGSVTGGTANQTTWYVGGTMNTPLKELKVGGSYDQSIVSPDSYGGSGGQNVDYVEVYGVYASYQATEKLSFNTRAEYGAASNPFTFINFTPSTGGGGIAANAGRKVCEVTETVAYDLWKNVLTRLEFRWDHAADGVSAYGDSGSGNTLKKNNFELIANFAYKF